MTDTEQKEQDFEGVRAEVFTLPDGGLTLELAPGTEDEIIFSVKCDHEGAKHILGMFADRWNNQATLKSEMNELADKIVELEKSSNNSLDKLGNSNGKLLLACSNLSDKDAEITRLKEENERLRGELKNENKLEHQGLKSTSRLKDITISDLQSQLSQAKERITELEKPDTFVCDSVSPNIQYKIIEDIMKHFGENEPVEIFCSRQFPELWAVKKDGITSCFDNEDFATDFAVNGKTHINTLEQAALKEGECKICNGHGSITDDFGAPLICECTVAGEPQQ